MHAGVAVLWCLLFAQAFFLKGVFAWGTGVAYVVYDTALLAFVFWQAWHLMRPDPEETAAPASHDAANVRLTLGVVVAAHNEAAALPVTLRALMAGRRVPDAIVIADDGSQDGTAALLTGEYGLTDPGLGGGSRRWFAGFLQTQYWYRDMVGNGRYGNLGRWMLPVKAFDTLQPIYGLTAFALLVTFVCEGHYGVVLPVSGIILGKIVLDLGFHLWSVHAYRRWTGQRTGTSLGLAFFAAVLEPFSFQLMRHTGAALGWGHFLTGRQRWGAQVRRGILSSERETEVSRDR